MHINRIISEWESPSPIWSRSAGYLDRSSPRQNPQPTAQDPGPVGPDGDQERQGERYGCQHLRIDDRMENPPELDRLLARLLVRVVVTRREG